MDVYCYPLDRWDGPETERRGNSGYGARWSTTLKDLETEAGKLGADEVLILLDVRRDQLRVDGWPKTGTDVPPRVAISFASTHGPLRFQCDRWQTWHENVRAIGITLQRLRLIDEGGVARSGEQYRGWAAIGTGSGATSAEQAIATLRRHAGPDGADSASWQDLYRLAAHRTHPDRGGNAEAFGEITAARDLLKANR